MVHTQRAHKTKRIWTTPKNIIFNSGAMHLRINELHQMEHPDHGSNIQKCVVPSPDAGALHLRINQLKTMSEKYTVHQLSRSALHLQS